MKNFFLKSAKLLGLVALCEGLGALGTIFTIPNISTWYAGLNKPTFTPPNYIFGPTWTLLYALMAIAFYLVLEAPIPQKAKKPAITLFTLQLVLNVLWSPIFFGMKLPYLALLDLTILWVALTATITKFKKISLKAGLLLVPYLGWVTFAGILNFYIAILN